ETAPEPVRRAVYRGLAMLVEPDAAPALQAAWTARRGPLAELAAALAGARAPGATGAFQALVGSSKATDLLYAVIAHGRLEPAQRQGPRLRAAIAALPSPFARERLDALVDAVEKDPAVLENA